MMRCVAAGATLGMAALTMPVPTAQAFGGSCDVGFTVVEADGGADIAAAIAAAHACASIGQTVSIGPGSYTHDAPFVLTRDINIVATDPADPPTISLSGTPGAVFDASGGRFGGTFVLEDLVVNTPDGWGLVSADAFTLELTNVSFDGGGSGTGACTDPDADTIDTVGTTLVLTDVTLQNGACHGVNATGALTVNGLSISAHRGDGVRLSGSGNKRLDFATISGNGGAGIDSSLRVTVVDSTISGNAAGVVLTNTIGFSTLGRVTIEDNTGAGVMATASDVTFSAATLRSNAPSCDFDAGSTVDDVASTPPNTDDDGSCSFAASPPTTTTTTTTSTTTTTLPATTTTAPTTTTAAPTTTATTQPATTTTTPVVLAPTTTATPVPTLPSTGRSTGVALLAAALVLLGWTLVRTSRV